MEEVFKIEAFRAIDNLDECLKYAQGHEDVLGHHGIKKVTTAGLEWVDDPGVYVFTVKKNDELLGGARIHIAGYKNPLPIQEALQPIDPSIDDVIDNYIPDRIGEICALWNAKKIAGLGMSKILVRSCLAKSGIVLADQLKLGKLIGLCAPWTVRLCKTVGYEIYEEMGEQGTYAYPKPDLRATVMMVQDPEKLAKAYLDEREMILDLRERPTKETFEKVPKGEVKVEYNLVFNHVYRMQHV